MRLLSKATALTLAACLPLALSVASPLHAASPWDGASRALACDHNAHVDAALQVCAIARDGSMHYLIDTVDGTHAVLTLSDGAVALRQSGPDSVRVLLGAPVDPGAIPSGIVRQVYRDGLLSIEEVQDGGHPPTWQMYPAMLSTVRPTQKSCNDQDCSGGIQQYTAMPLNTQPAQ